tara:strand:+ start:288 stop:671 length:384 start_codon:yes stop_codon:yes gene_type:complete
MASELRVTTIANNAGSESVNTTYVVNGSAKAWANHDASASLDDSFNTSSITDTGTGHYGLNFSSSMNNADYIMSGSNLGSTADFATCPTSDGGAPTSSTMDYQMRNMSSVAATDQTHNRVLTHGDLA